MAQGWDSYFHNLPPLASEPSTLTRTSESQGSLSHHIENYVGHHDFPSTEASHEACATNSNFDTNYYSNPGSDCLYQTYVNETPWQADGEQTGKDHMRRCGNNEIKDLATEGLSTSGSFPSSFATDLQELKQDCGMLATSFLEGYSDVSSCSDADLGETRPSCKFMGGKLVPKSKTDVTIKPSSSEWLFTDRVNMMVPTESRPNMSETNVALPSTSSNVMAGENIVKDKMDCPVKTVKSYRGHNQSSATLNMVETTVSKPVEEKKDNGGCPDQIQKTDVKEDLAQGKHSNISISGNEKLTDGLQYPDSNEEGQISAPVPNSMTTSNNVQELSGEEVLTEEIEESFNPKNGNPNTTNDQDGNMQEDKQDISEVLKRDGRELSPLKKETFDEQTSPNPNSNDGQDEIMEINCQKKEIQSYPDQQCIKLSDSTELGECTSTLKSNNRDVQSCLHLSSHQFYKCLPKSNISLSPAVMSDDHLSNAFDKNEQYVESHLDPCLRSTSSSKNVNPCLEKEWTSSAENINTNSPDCSVPSVTCLPIDTSDKNKQDVANNVESCLQSTRPSTDTNPYQETESTSSPEKSAPTSLAPDCSGTALTGDNKEQSVSNGLQCCSRSNTLNTDITTFLEKKLTGPPENTNVTSCPDQQKPQHQSPVALEQGSLNGDVAKNAAELETSTEEQSLSGILYGEPLSREDSSCDADETKLDRSPYKYTSVVRPDSIGMNFPEEQAPQLKSSIEMRKRLQPVVILKTPESVSGASNSYHCADCQHTTHNVDHLIEHHHDCHSMQNFLFCKTCNVYLMKKEQSKKHVCCVTKDGHRLSSDSSLPTKKKRRGKHKCIRCGLIFSKITKYVTHIRSHTGKTPYKCNVCGSYFAQSSSMRRHKQVPGRCKGSQLQVKNSDANSDIKETKMPQQKDHMQNKQYPNLLECYVKLVNISETHPCSLCGKNFSTLDKAKKHFHNVHKGKGLAVPSSQCTTKQSGKKNPEVESETRGKYKCPLCPRLFKYSYNRARHLRDCVRNAISDGKERIDGKYRCPLCRVTFTLSSNRYRHIKSFCIRECVNRLSKERAPSKEQIAQKRKEKRKEIEREKTAQASTTLETPLHYKCNLCPAVFRYASGKYRHMKKHEVFKLTGKMFKYRNSVFSTLSKPATLSCTNTKENKDDSKSAETTESLALSCKFCGGCFDTPQSLKKHVRSHGGEKPYRCLECGKAFKRQAHLISHKKVHQKRIQCTVCRKILPTIGELIQHRSSHHKKGMLRCPDCRLQFQFPAQLLRHLEAHKKKENRTSQLGERPSLEPQESLDLVKDQDGPTQPQCSLCKEVFNDAQLLRKHCLTHISVSSSNQCPFCKDHFPNRRYLLRHTIKHTGDKPLSCTNCGRQFYRDLYLKLHREKCMLAQTRDVVPNEPCAKRGPHLCMYCPRAFSKKIRLKSHHRGHKSNSLLLCSRCGQYFGFTKLTQHQKNCTETSVLNNGLSSVNGNACKSNSQTSQQVCIMPLKSNAIELLKFKCTHCKKRFRYRSLLLRHLVTHTGVEPFSCMHCGQRFGTRTMYLQHEAFCDGVNKEGLSKVKAVAATQLSKMPTLSEAAQMPKADGKAELKCKFCTKTFMKSRSLRRHILTHNEVKPYRCKACDCCFSRYDHLKVHQARCKGKKTRLEVCIPKISLDDVGKGWKNRIGMLAAAEKMETFECKVCSRSFSTQSKLSRHGTMFHTTKLFKCTHCGSSFSHEKSLKKHRKVKKCRTRSKEKNSLLPLETNPPTENVTNPLNVIRNRIIHRIQPYLNKKYKHTCSYCPRAFQNTWQLRVHIRLHTGERPYACDDCGQRFIRKDYVKRHAPKCTKKRFNVTQRLSKSTVCKAQQSTTRSPSKGFSCAYCSSRFLLFSQLQEHFSNAHKLETKVAPIPSAPLQHHLSNIPNIKEEPLDEICDEWLSDGAKSISKLDAAPDSNVPNLLPCPVCDMSFTNKAGLSGHLRVHTMELPFHCKTCRKGFWNKRLLRNHNRKCKWRHTSERSTIQQLEVPLKAEIDFVLNDSVLLFTETSDSNGTGVLQTNFSCKDDLVDKSPENSEGKPVQSISSPEKKAVQYQCSECDKSFTDGLMLISHLEDHGRQEEAYRRKACFTCGEEFSNRGHLARHMKIHETKEKYSCPDCSMVVKTSSDLNIHRTCHDPNRPFPCKLCNHRFWTRPSLYNHYREDHTDDVFTCRLCNKAYSVKKSLSRHYRKWHPQAQMNPGRPVKQKSMVGLKSSSRVSTAAESGEERNTGSEDTDSDSAPYFPCHVCGKTFPTSEGLEDHQRCHLGEKPHECAECGRCFFQASQLQQHQRMHKSEFQCQLCGRGFVSLFALRKHKHTHGKSRPYRCSRCDFSFTGPLQLAEHMSTHREENFPCDICNRVFLSKSSRVEHRKSHSKASDYPPPLISSKEYENSDSLSEGSSASLKELKYRCGVCGERFPDPEELSEHGCIKAKERPYPCSDCHQHFLHASHLKKHRNSYHILWSNGEYTCNQCNNSFSTSQQFLHHLKSHGDAAENERNTEGTDGAPSPDFICPICHQCFARATELIRHFPTHPNGSFNCNICKMTFASRSTLEEHERRHVTSATEFKCTECGQSFWGEDAFKQHHCSHHKHASKEAEYSNPSAKTSTPTYYQAAVEEEEIDIDVTGEDLYNCQVCSKQFSSKSSLLDHQNKEHRNEKPFKCELCGNTFAKRRYLAEHERRHRQKNSPQSKEGNKFARTQWHANIETAHGLSSRIRLGAEKEVGKFRCDMCYKSFSRWSQLKQHQESHVGEVVYECTECDKAFAFPHLLEEHQQTHAGSSR